jgi:hypothetical protein
MVNRIYSIQATRSYKPAAVSALVHVILAGERRSGAKSAQGGGDCNHDESLVSIHDGFPLLPDATWILGRFQRTARATVHCCGSAHPHYRPRFGRAFFLRWMSCEHPHDRTGRILRSTSVAGRPGAIILEARDRSRDGNLPTPLRDQEGRQAGHDLAALRMQLPAGVARGRYFRSPAPVPARRQGGCDLLG